MVMCILPYNRIIQEGNVPKLCSLSKLFERCLLELMECGPLEGNFHYGFRANHSTVTAMLEIQSEIAENLDKGKSTLMYANWHREGMRKPHRCELMHKRLEK